MSMLILFGAGVYAKKYRALLEYLDMGFDYFTDNDSSKWGTLLYGKKIIAPKELKTFPDSRIIISSTHEAAIKRQLAGMGMEKNIIGLDTLYDLCEQKQVKSPQRNAAAGGKKTILVDMYEGIGWGGSELWAANLARGLNEAGNRAILLGSSEQPELEKIYEDMTVRISGKDIIMQFVQLIEDRLPCVFINNFAGCAFMAAAIIKRKYPDLIKVVSVIHSDSRSLFDAYMMMGKYTDRIFCVSRQIRSHIQGVYDLDHVSCYVKEQPVWTDGAWRRAENRTEPLRIGYAGRIVKQAKRADLLVELVESLERNGMDYTLQIAGEGECLEMIRQYVVDNNLQDKVHLTGRLPKSGMDSFWKNQDVFVNVSEYEGTSLSMLEAMGYGCVPVVTDVSGAREFIEDRQTGYKNGYIRAVGDMDGIAECIIELSCNRELLKTYGDRCRRIVQERCNPQEYIKYWTDKVLEGWL